MRARYAEEQIPEAGKEAVPYPDYAQVVNKLLKHTAEAQLRSVTGAGGAGGTIEGIPFEPAVVIAINAAGATPTTFVSMFGGDAARHVSIAAATAANANPPVKSGSGTDWDLAIPTQMAPNGESLSVLILGFSDAGNGE